MNINTKKVNKFGETAKDIAINNYDKISLQILDDHDKQIELNKITEIERKNNTLKIENNKINNDNIFLKNEIVILKNDKKRLRDENEIIEESNKKLKKDIKTYQEILKNKK
jgi:hypothetical protein